MDTDYQSPLSTRYTVDILTLIYEEKRIMATDLLRIAKNYKTVIKTAENLRDMGLLSEHLESGTRLMKIYELTPAGETVAAPLLKARQTLYGIDTADEEEKPDVDNEKPHKSNKKPKKKSSKNKK